MTINQAAQQFLDNPSRDTWDQFWQVAGEMAIQHREDECEEPLRRVLLLWKDTGELWENLPLPVEQMMLFRPWLNRKGYLPERTYWYNTPIGVQIYHWKAVFHYWRTKKWQSFRKLFKRHA